MNRIQLRVPLLALLLWGTALYLAHSACGQLTNADWLQQIDVGETQQDRATAIRALGVSLIQQTATNDERIQILEAFKNVASDPDPVMRLAVNAEMLKVAAAESNVPLSELAMRAMGDENINVRRGVIKFFRAYFASQPELGQTHEAQLKRLIKSDDLETRCHAAATLHAWNISDEAIIEILIDSLDLQNYRAASVYLLVTDQQFRPLVIEKLFARLDKSVHNAGVYINVLSLLTPDTNPYIGRIIPFFDSEIESVRAAVVDALGRMKSDNNNASIALLVRALDDPSSLIRRLTLPSLIQLEPDPKLYQNSMLKLLMDSDEQVAMAASDTFSFFENRFDQLLPELKKIFAGENNRHIISALNGCMTAGPLAESVSADVFQLLQHESSDVRLRAIWTIHEIRADRLAAINAYNKLLASETNTDVISNALNSLELLGPTDDASRELFLKFLEDPDQFIRLSCVNGLRNFISADLTERLLRVPNDPNEETDSALTQLDSAIINLVAETGNEGAKVALQFIDDQDKTLRLRAIRIVGQSTIVDDGIRGSFVAALAADQPTPVRLAAAVVVSRFPNLEPEWLTSIFEIADQNDRQLTIQILGMLSGIGEQASLITPAIAQLIDGRFRGRFANEARQVLITLGPHAAPALPILLSGKMTLPKLDCIAAIGSAASPSVDTLKALIQEHSALIAAGRSIHAINLSRRMRLSAAMALAAVSGDSEPASKIIREELQTETRPLAIAAIVKLAPVDPTLVDNVIALLPEKDAVNALGSIGSLAKRALDSLRKIAAGGDIETSYVANKAIWQIADDPQLAIDTLQQAMERSRYETVEVRTEDRQKVWEMLRYLATKQNSYPAAKALLDKIQRGRFPNLREFVRQLPAE